MSFAKRRIVFFSAYYPPHLGGVEKFTQNLSKALTKMGHEVLIVTSSLNKPADIAEKEDKKIRVIEITSKSIMDDRLPIITSPKSIQHTIRRVNNYNPTDIVINTRYYPLSLLGCKIAKGLGLRPLVIDHSSGYLSHAKTPTGFAMRKYESLVTSLMLSSNPVFASVSQGGSKWLSSIGLSCSGIIPNSLDAKAYKELASDRNWKKEMQVEESNFVIVFAGRLIPEKGPLKLINAARRLSKTHSDFVVVIAGDGPLKETISLINEHWLKFVGKLEQSDLSSLLNASDCFCLPTEYPEGLPTVLLEAAVQENAIIVSNCAGSEEVVPNEKYGTILKDTTPQTIAKSIEQYIDDRSRAAQQASEARKYVEMAFSWNKTSEKLLDLLDKQR